MNRHTVPVIKRLIDVVFGTLLLVLLAPPMLVIALAVKLGSRGPVFYKQKRAGVLSNGREAPEFYVYKFRTMVQDAEAASGAVLAEKNDCRVTRIGHFLRVTRLDELPQFLNVLKGEMSIVGPRPERPELMDTLNLVIPFFEERLRFVKPGITGLAQINLRYDGDIPENDKLAHLKRFLVNPLGMEELDGAPADGMRLKLIYDMQYSACLERFSSFILTDIGIMLKTPFVMFVRRTGR